MPASLPISRQPIGYFAVIGAIFLTAFILSCAFLGRYVPFPYDPAVGAKIEHLARHGDDYDVLFIGSSRVHHQIMPTIFDRVARMNGMPVKSFNAGMMAMFSPEDGYVLEEILRRPHRRLRWVFLELSSLETQRRADQTSRFPYWHDTIRLMFVVRALHARAAEGQANETEKTFSDRCQQWAVIGGNLWVHVCAWLIRETNVNSGGEILNRWFNVLGWSSDPRSGLGNNGDGWLSERLSDQQMAPALRANYEQVYADRLVSPAGKYRDDAVWQAALERSLAAISKAGCRPILIVPPMIVKRTLYPTEARERELTILDFSDMRQYPELFAPEHRTDFSHLNTAGAEIFSDILARRFVELVKGRAPNFPGE
jgi:hypothetical protein